MKKKLLPLAVLAGLAGAAGTAQANHINSDGLGQVLIYPYYSAVAGNDTYIAIANTTNKTKAVKVRFLEGHNSREVLDFNLYLSAYDHWSAAIVPTGDGGAKVITGDKSCTVPAIPEAGQPFRNLAYANDGGPSGLARTLEGYVEIIEMADLAEEDADGVITEFGPAPFGAGAAIKHAAGVPADCNALVKAWTIGGAGNGTWIANPAANTVAGSGGLYGYGNILNVDNGTAVGYSATAIDNFNRDVSNHFNPGTASPSLSNGLPFADVLVNDAGNSLVSVISDDLADGVDAVSAVLTRDTLSNDYVTDEGLDASTDWVITFPTKKFYVDRANLADRAPFTSQFGADLACEHIEVSYWDREEGSIQPDPANPIPPGFSPSPDEADPESPAGWRLCTEVNVISFNGESLLGSDALNYGLNLADGFINGWAQIDFTAAFPEGTLPADQANYNAREIVGTDYTFHGLPVVGFAVQQYVNGNVGGVLSNYTSVVEHKYTRNIEAN